MRGIDNAFDMFEIVVTHRDQTRWEWRVYGRDGRPVMGGWEEARRAARYRAERALFQLLLVTRRKCM